MADIADMAADKDFTEEILTRHRNSVHPTKPSRVPGVCTYCDRKIAKNLVFCNNECREDYEWEASIKAKRSK